MTYFDDRIFKLTFTYADTELTLDGRFAITAFGTKYANALQNECSLTVANLKKETRDHLLTQLTPYNYDQKRKSVAVYAGRESTGLYLLYKGDIIECYASQPPDIILHIKCMALAWYKYQYVAQSYNLTAPLSQIADGIGQTLGTPVKFVATDRNVSNYSYSGCAAKQIDLLNELNVQAYEDSGTLVVKDKGTPLPDTCAISQDTGMIGTPQLTQYGIKVKTLLNPNVVLGGQVQLESKINPLLNGLYYTDTIGFEIASRDTPFYAIIQASKYPILYGQYIVGA